MIIADADFLTHKEAASIARCSENTLHNWEPPCRRRKGRKWLYPREEFIRWLSDTPTKERIDHPRAPRQNRRSLYRRGG